MDCPCRSGLSDGFDLRSGMGQGGTGGSPPTPNPLYATAGPQQFISQLWTSLAPGSRAPAVPRYLVSARRSAVPVLALDSLVPPQHHSPSAVPRRCSPWPVHPPAQPMLGPCHCSLKESQFPSSARISSHRIASHHAAHTHPRYPTCCVVNAAQGPAICSLALELGQPSHGLHRVPPSPLCQQSAFLASRISHHTPADSAVYVAGEIMTGIPPSTGMNIHHL